MPRAAKNGAGRPLSVVPPAGGGVQPQLGLDERVVEDEALLAALDEREAARTELGQARLAYKKLHQEVSSRLERMDLGIDTAIRVGRFRITKTSVPGRHTEFDTNPSERVTIKLWED